MEPDIRSRYTSAIEAEALRRYAIPPDMARKIDAFESFVYEYQLGRERRILRVAHTLRRSVDTVRAEIDWIEHLAERGANVARSLPSPGGAYVETVPDDQGGTFVISAFANAPGEQPRDAEHARAIAEEYGQAVGRMHALTKGYTPAADVVPRPHLLDEIEQHVRQWLPPDQTACIQRFDALVSQLRGLPVGRDAYGMVHGDAHRWNFHVDASAGLTFFDFDDCGYSWFAYDLAVILFCTIAESDPRDIVTDFLRRFFRGYARENRLDRSWLEEMRGFLKLREIYDYTAIHRSLDVDSPSEPWASFMDGRQERIEADVPVLDIDFSTLEDIL